VCNPGARQLTAAQQGEVNCAEVALHRRRRELLRPPGDPPQSKGKARAYTGDQSSNQRQVAVEWPDIRWAPGPSNPRRQVAFRLPFG
jgi:hypothetical protein